MGDIASALRKIGATDVAGGGYTQGGREALQPKAPQGAKPPVVGVGRTPASGSGSGGEMQETSVADREYWTDETVTSTDGAFTWIVKPIKRVKLTSGGSIRFAEPTP